MAACCWHINLTSKQRVHKMPLFASLSVHASCPGATTFYCDVCCMLLSAAAVTSACADTTRTLCAQQVHSNIAVLQSATATQSASEAMQMSLLYLARHSQHNQCTCASVFTKEFTYRMRCPDQHPRGGGCVCLQSQRSSSPALQAQGITDQPDKQAAATPPGEASTPDDTQQNSDASQHQANSSQSTQQGTDIVTDGQISSAAAQASRESEDGAELQPGPEEEPENSSNNDGRTAHLASLAEQADIRQALCFTSDIRQAVCSSMPISVKLSKACLIVQHGNTVHLLTSVAHSTSQRLRVEA